MDKPEAKKKRQTFSMKEKVEAMRLGYSQVQVAKKRNIKQSTLAVQYQSEL